MTFLNEFFLSTGVWLRIAESNKGGEEEDWRNAKKCVTTFCQKSKQTSCSAEIKVNF